MRDIFELGSLPEADYILKVAWMREDWKKTSLLVEYKNTESTYQIVKTICARIYKNIGVPFTQIVSIYSVENSKRWMENFIVKWFFKFLYYREGNIEYNSSKT